jgi:hypothetical protein
MNLAQLEYDYRVQYNKEYIAIDNNCKFQREINDEHLNKLKCDLNICKLNVDKFKQYTKDFMADHPNIKYPIE